jgi:site-specific DNA-methyltransferase (adenine-specific)
MINLHLGDSLQAMREMPDNHYELAIVDPPFGIGNFIQTTGWHKDGVKRNAKKVTWNNKTPSIEYFDQLRRVSKHQIIFGANYFNSFGGKHGAIVWVKNQPMPNFSKAVIASCTLHQKIEIYTQTWTNFVANGRCTKHPCEMPVQLYQWLLDNYAKPGDRIIDTHLGSGSIACACYDSGYALDAWELDPEYHAQAVARYKEYSRQTKLF